MKDPSSTLPLKEKKEEDGENAAIRDLAAYCHRAANESHASFALSCLDSLLFEARELKIARIFPLQRRMEFWRKTASDRKDTCV